MENLAQCFCFSNLKQPPTPKPTIEELCRRFTLEEIQKSTNNFDQSRKIGEANFGPVYKGSIHGGTDYTVAIKRRSRHSQHTASEFKNEVELLCQLRHPNLISLVGFCDDKKEMIIVYEYLPNRSLDDNLRENPQGLSWKRRLEICIGAARGLHHLHTGAKHTIIHRNVHPWAILLDENWVPKLSGFGFSIKGPSSLSKPKPIEVDILAGQIGFLAPEYAKDLKLTDKSDVYSFGMVMLHVVWERFDGSRRFVDLEPGIFDLVHERRLNEILDPILIGEIAPESLDLFMEIVSRCLLLDPTERPIIGEVEVELERVLELQDEADAMNEGI